MANNVTFIIQLKDQFGKVAQKVQNQFAHIKNGADKAGESIRDKLGKSFSGIRTEAKGLVSELSALAAITATIRIGSQFQDAMAELQAITGVSGSQLQSLGDDTMRLARAFGVSQDIVANAMTQVASAKSELLSDPKQLAMVTQEALRLSKAAGISVPDAVRASIGALNQFGAGADQAARFVNVIAAGAKVGASMVDETADALKNAGTVAAQFGVSFEEVNALIQVLAKNEIKGAEAGTALRGTLSKLEKFAGGRFAPSKIGIIKSLEMIEKLGLSNTEIIKEFGEENLRTIMVLRQNTPLVKQWTNELTNTGVAADQAGVRMATFSEKTSRAWVSIKSIMIKVFTGIEPVLSALVDAFTFVINLIDGLLSAWGSFIGQFVAAWTSLDFSQFDFNDIKDRFLGAFGETTINASATPSAPVGQASGSINGNIVVSAAPGSRVESTRMQSTGNGLDVGVNMAMAR